MDQSSLKSLLRYQWLLWWASSINKRNCQCKAGRYSPAFDSDDSQKIRVTGNFTERVGMTVEHLRDTQVFDGDQDW